MRVAIFRMPFRERSEAVCSALEQGARAVGLSPEVIESRGLETLPEADVAFMYGMSPHHRMVFDALRARGMPVFTLDLPYWGRDPDVYRCYYKLALNAYHPDVTGQEHPPDRFRVFGKVFQPMQDNPDGHFLVAGLSQKGEQLYKCAGWDWQVATILAQTGREIVFRPKAALDLRGAPVGCRLSSQKTEPVGNVLRNCYAVVTHHSNVALDAAIAGIRSVSFLGPGRALGAWPGDLEHPKLLLRNTDREREQLCFNLAYWQYTLTEMKTSEFWRHVHESLDRVRQA